MRSAADPPTVGTSPFSGTRSCPNKSADKSAQATHMARHARKSLVQSPTPKMTAVVRQAAKPARVGQKFIHPLIMYPFNQPSDYRNLEALYTGLVKQLAQNNSDFSKGLAANRAAYATPITILNQQTFHNNARFRFDEQRTWNTAFKSFIQGYVEKYSKIVPVWSVDTCQMWLDAFGYAYDNKRSGEDVYWLIPGDFDYASRAGQDVLKIIEKLPEAVMNSSQDLAVGEIKVEPNSSKQLIDTYGTYGLLYNWFPNEA